jgi:hypothetical protein
VFLFGLFSSPPLNRENSFPFYFVVLSQDSGHTLQYFRLSSSFRYSSLKMRNKNVNAGFYLGYLFIVSIYINRSIQSICKYSFFFGCHVLGHKITLPFPTKQKYAKQPITIDESDQRFVKEGNR